MSVLCPSQLRAPLFKAYIVLENGVNFEPPGDQAARTKGELGGMAAECAPHGAHA